MSKINVLNFEIANLIAAGEVVERPASVIKELIENSIDSGASEIVCEIKKGGVSLIRVTDNGCGMDKEDLPISLKRHATSKIKEKDDLNSIMTLGFRGEALAAISSVSEMTIISKTEKSKEANMLVAHGGNIVDISEVGASNGTTVVVENLFYNVPARRKFLKKDSTEAMNVCAIVERIALSQPKVSIQLIVDGEQKFKTAGDNNLQNTIYSVLGRDFAQKIIECNAELDGIKVYGFIGRSDNVKKNRNLQNIFINGRYVKSLTVMAALEKAYTSYIAPECFPACVLFLEMSPGIVDVNVHPAKLEVKFSDERIIFDAVYHTVKNALEKFEYRPQMILDGKRNSERNATGAFVPLHENTKGEQVTFGGTIKSNNTDFTQDKKNNSGSRGLDYSLNKSFPSDNYKKTERINFSENSFGSGRNQNNYSESKSQYKDNNSFDRRHYATDNNADMDGVLTISSGASPFRDESGFMSPKDSLELLKMYSNTKAETANGASENIEKKEAIKEKPVEKNTEYKICGEVFNCYIMVEYEGALYIIDKHAAHERIIFEDLKKMREEDGRVGSQTLLLPLSVMITPTEYSSLSEFSDEISTVGFEYDLQENVANITAIPDAIGADDAETLFIKMADELHEGRGNPAVTDSIRREKALYQIACKAAIKGGRVYDKNIIEWLVQKVFELPDITVCPHGRPIAYKLTKTELDRQFERIK